MTEIDEAVRRAGELVAEQYVFADVAAQLRGILKDGRYPADLPDLADQVTRDLSNLKHFGWAEQIATTGRWRLGPQVVQIATRHMTAIERASKKLAEVSNRYSRSDS